MEQTEAAVAEPVLSWPQSVAEFDALIEATQHRLVRFAYCRLHMLADAEDVVQDVLVQAFRDRERYRNVDNVVPFLFRMVANSATDVLRKRQRFTEAPHRTANVSERPAPEPEHWVERLLDRLPPPQAEVIRLRVYGELPFDDVARSVGCSVPTVKSRFRYGLEKLRTLLGRSGGER
jgi:RNA polymerase sigma-70 factor (ECF subfamily)